MEGQRTVGRLLRARREATGLSQERLAEITGISQTYISRIERGDVRFPNDETLAKLGDALGIARAEWFREAAGEDGLEVSPRPAYPEGDARADYTPGEVAEIVAFVESRPGERFREQLAEERRRRSRASYERFCVALFRAWGANAQLAFSAAANGRAE